MLYSIKQNDAISIDQEEHNMIANILTDIKVEVVSSRGYTRKLINGFALSLLGSNTKLYNLKLVVVHHNWYKISETVVLLLVKTRSRLGAGISLYRELTKLVLEKPLFEDH